VEKSLLDISIEDKKLVSKKPLQSGFFIYFIGTDLDAK